MSHVIRLAKAADAMFLPLVEQSAGALFREVPDLAWIADHGVMSATEHRAMMRRGRTWIASTPDGRIDAFLCALDAGDALHIREVSVHARARRMGIGARLIQTCLEAAAAEGRAAVTLTTFRDVPWNAPYYARLGFTLLRDEELDDRLRAILADEEARGLSSRLRCAMRRSVLALPSGGV